MFADTTSDKDACEGDMSDTENDNSDRQPQTSLHTTTAQGCVNSVIFCKKVLVRL